MTNIIIIVCKSLPRETGKKRDGGHGSWLCRVPLFVTVGEITLELRIGDRIVIKKTFSECIR